MNSIFKKDASKTRIEARFDGDMDMGGFVRVKTVEELKEEEARRNGEMSEPKEPELDDNTVDEGSEPEHNTQPEDEGLDIDKVKLEPTSTFQNHRSRNYKTR